MPQTRLLIVGDFSFVREAISATLNTEPTIDVVGEVGSQPDIATQVEKLQPDVVLMDFATSTENSVQIIEDIKRHNPAVKVLLLTEIETPILINKVLEIGVDGYLLLKDTDRRYLLKAIEAVQQGDVPLHPLIAHILLGDRIRPRNISPVNHLTEREKEVLQLLTKGMSNRSIAQTLNLTEGTIKIYVSNILKKLKVSGRTEAAIKAVELGLVSDTNGKDNIPF